MFSVRTATDADVPFLVALQKRNTDSLGFLPKAALSEYVRAHVVILGLENDEPAGYLLGRRRTRDDPTLAKIYQACVQYDARRHLLGTLLVEEFVASLPAHARALALWCAKDLDTNVFWMSQGFAARGFRNGGDFRGRVHILWHRWIDGTSPTVIPILPAQSFAGNLNRTRDIHAITQGLDWRSIERVPDQPCGCVDAAVTVPLRGRAEAPTPPATSATTPQPTPPLLRSVDPLPAWPHRCPDGYPIRLLVGGRVKCFPRHRIFT